MNLFRSRHAPASKHYDGECLNREVREKIHDYRGEAAKAIAESRVSMKISAKNHEAATDAIRRLEELRREESDDESSK